MKRYTATMYLDADCAETMNIIKMNQEDYDLAAECGARILFEIETDLGMFRFVDCSDIQDQDSYLILRFDDSDKVDYYALELKDYYSLAALFMSGQHMLSLGNRPASMDHPCHWLYHIVNDGDGIAA